MCGDGHACRWKRSRWDRACAWVDGTRVELNCAPDECAEGLWGRVWLHGPSAGVRWITSEEIGVAGLAVTFGSFNGPDGFTEVLRMP